MKLATRKDGSRDGQLTVVSRDLKQAVLAEQIAPTLQDALDDWRFIAPQLQDLYERLNQGKAPRSFDFAAREYMAPLPRPFERIQAAAYPAFVERLQRAGLPPNAALPPLRTAGPGAPAALAQPCFALASTSRLMAGQAPISLSGLALTAASDGTEAVAERREAEPPPACPQDATSNADTQADGSAIEGLDFSAQLVAITDDTPIDLAIDEAQSHILLLGLANGWRIHPSTGPAWQADRGLAFAPVVLTPDELEDDWREGRLHRPLHCRLNGRSTGRMDAAEGMAFDFRQLLCALSQYGPIHAGSLVCSGPVANRSSDSGCTSIIEARARHRLDGLAGEGPGFLQAGSRVRIDMADRRGHPLFGTIEQHVVS